MPDELNSPDLTERVLNVIARTQRISREKVTITSSFEDLGMDSMDGVNILFALENEFDITIPDDQAKSIRSIQQMVDGVARLVADAQSSAQRAG